MPQGRGVTIAEKSEARQGASGTHACAKESMRIWPRLTFLNSLPTLVWTLEAAPVPMHTDTVTGNPGPLRGAGAEPSDTIRLDPVQVGTVTGSPEVQHPSQRRRLDDDLAPAPSERQRQGDNPTSVLPGGGLGMSLDEEVPAAPQHAPRVWCPVPSCPLADRARHRG